MARNQLVYFDDEIDSVFFPLFLQFSANRNNISCEMVEHHQCTRLTGCTYFESLIQKGTDALTIGSELRKLFCGFDGFDIMVIHSYLFELLLFCFKNYA